MKNITETSWDISIIVSSDDYNLKYRKWNPFRKDYFCKIDNQKCLKTICPRKVDYNPQSREKIKYNNFLITI